MRREPRNSSISEPRFQRGAGVYDHTGGTYSHNKMMDYVRLSISEVHLVRTDFPDYDMLDAMIASALKSSRQAHSFPQKVSKSSVLKSTRAYEAVQGLSDLFNIRLQNDGVQDFDVRWDPALLSANDMPSDVILEGLYKSKLQDSVQLQTALALFDQETVRNNGQTSYSRLKTSVKVHIDQMMRTRNFRVRNEVVKEEQSPRVQKERRPALKEKCESVFSGKLMDNV